VSSLRVIPIVEGEGEVVSVPRLLERIWYELLGEQHIDVLRPIRQPRTSLVKPGGLRSSVELAADKLRARANDGIRGLVLIVLDADDDLPCSLAPQLLAAAQAIRADVDIACVLANQEYETWFVAAAESLPGYLVVPDGAAPLTPETDRLKKKWVQDRFRGTGEHPSYHVTVDQPRMTAIMDLALCRSRSPSFDKLCRELEARR
jgi:hypothetical protein